MSSTRRHVTILIIGSGIAGCTAALTLADAGRDVLLINAGPDLDDGNTPLAQGGIIYKAADTPRDAEARALEHDILVAGHRYNNNRAVRFLCRQGPDCVDNMLIERAGVDFDRNEDGTYNLTREGGHGAHRILHKADYSGRALMDGLAAQVKIHPRITCLHNHSAIDLLTTHHHAKNSQYRYSVTNQLEYIHNLSSLVKGLELRGRVALSQTGYYALNFTTKPFFYRLQSFDESTGGHKLFALNAASGDRTIDL